MGALFAPELRPDAVELRQNPRIRSRCSVFLSSSAKHREQRPLSSPSRRWFNGLLAFSFTRRLEGRCTRHGKKFAKPLDDDRRSMTQVNHRHGAWNFSPLVSIVVTAEQWRSRRSPRGSNTDKVFSAKFKGLDGTMLRGSREGN